MEILEAAQSYWANGFVVIEDVLSSREIAHVFTVIDRLALSLIAPSTVDVGQNPFLWLVRHRRRDAGYLFDCLVKIPEVSQMLFSPTLQRLSETLLQTDLALASASQMNLRADHPGEGRFLYPWHHDYAYNCGARNSVVFWIPLQDVDEVNGCLHVIPGSHRLATEIQVKDARAGNSAEWFRVANMEEILKDHSEVRIPMRGGSVLALSGLLLHKSGANLSDRSRFALQSRWFDGLAKDAVSGRWRGGMDEGRSPAEYLSATMGEIETRCGDQTGRTVSPENARLRPINAKVSIPSGRSLSAVRPSSNEASPPARKGRGLLADNGRKGSCPCR